jgi:penicillin-binding protein 1A
MKFFRLRRVLVWLSALMALGIIASVGAIAGVFLYYGRGVEGIDVSTIRNYRPYQVTRITARDGTVLGEIFKERRTLIAFGEIPSHVENAFIAAEDAEFYHHEGMDYFGMARAMLSNIEAGQIRQGASTITQQVVKNFLLSSERTFERKVQELILARRLEQALTKQQILELYLNEIFFGHGRYGIEEASRFYFGRSVREINLGQAALLAAMPKAPSKGSPHKDPERAKARQVYVLKQMVRHGFAAPRDAQVFIDAPLEVIPPGREDVVLDEGQEFVDAAHDELLRRFGEETLLRLGATVTTTVDLEIQRQARLGLLSGLIELDQRQGFGHKIKAVNEKKRAAALKKVEGELALGVAYPAVILPPDPSLTLPLDAVPVQIGAQKVMLVVPVGSRYDDPKLEHAAQFPADGITMVQVTSKESGLGQPDGWWVGSIGSGPEAAVGIADNATGELLAMVGGTVHARGSFNRFTQAKRQPGSSFKPFVYGAALASQRFSAATLVEDSPEIYEKWRPTNFEGELYRGAIRLRVALTHSINTIAIKLVDSIGFEAVHEFARAAGITSPLSPNLALALGVSELTPLELLGGYLTLARGGSRIPATMIKRIEAPGMETWTSEAQPVQALREDVVFVLTSMMESVVKEGTGQRAQALNRPVAGKTGTSAEHRDAWFAGFTANYVAVAWVGFDRPRALGKAETGGRAALPVWLAAMRAAEGASLPRSFVPPASVEVRMIDKRSGLLAPALVVAADGSMVAPSADEVMEEYFVAGTEPLDHAEPGAMAAGDAVLDLYGDGEERIPAVEGERADGADLQAAPVGRNLPSVTDDP